MLAQTSTNPTSPAAENSFAALFEESLSRQEMRVGEVITAEVVSVDDVGGGWFQVVTRFTLEVEGSDKPCCVAESVGRALV